MPIFNFQRERIYFPTLIDDTTVTLAPNNSYTAVLDAGELTRASGYEDAGGAGSSVRIRYSEAILVWKTADM